MTVHPPAPQTGPDLTLLPFGGLGLDLAEVRRKAHGLLLVPFPTQEAPRHRPRLVTPPAPSGYGLLVRLSRETLGS